MVKIKKKFLCKNKKKPFTWAMSHRTERKAVDMLHYRDGLTWFTRMCINYCTINTPHPKQCVSTKCTVCKEPKEDDLAMFDVWPFSYIINIFEAHKNLVASMKRTSIYGCVSNAGHQYNFMVTFYESDERNSDHFHSEFMNSVHSGRLSTNTLPKCKNMDYYQIDLCHSRRDST